MNAAVFRIPGQSSGAAPAFDQSGADQAADERVRRARRNAVVPGDQVPRNRADERTENHAAVDEGGIDDALADRRGHGQVKERPRKNVEERGPEHRLPRLEHAGGYDGGDGVRRVVEAVHEIEGQREQHQQHQRHGDLSEIHASRIRPASAVLEHDAFDDVRDVLALVGGRLERLIHGLELDQLAHVGLVAEQPRNGAAHHLVGFGFELVDLLADLEHCGSLRPSTP